MSSASNHSDHATLEKKGIAYPENHVLGVLDSRAQVKPLIAALKAGGFVDEEIDVQTGVAAADHLESETGRKGFTGLANRFMEAIGATNEEMEVKRKYEDAMRDNRFVVAIATPSDLRKDRAIEILKSAEAHTVVSFAKFTMSIVVPSRA